MPKVPNPLTHTSKSFAGAPIDNVIDEPAPRICRLYGGSCHSASPGSLAVSRPVSALRVTTLAARSGHRVSFSLSRDLQGDG